jgi:hypothetical protein
MKKFSLIVAAAAIALSSLAVNAGSAPNVDRVLKEKMDCYRAHHKIMDKPSLQTLDACWKAHHQLMK